MWSPGEIVIRREVLNDGRAWLLVPVIVVDDRPDLFATYIAPGTPFDHGRFDIVLEPFPDGELGRARELARTGEGSLDSA